MNRKSILALEVLYWLGMLVALSSCTITPKATYAAQPSDWAKANLVGYNSTGLYVGTDWVRAYHELVKTYGDKLPINQRVPLNNWTGITHTKWHNVYHVTFAVNRRFADLELIEKGSGP